MQKHFLRIFLTYNSREFEILNDFSNTPSVSDIQQEFSQFEGFEITEEVDEHANTPIAENDFDDFKSLYSNDYVDLDNPETEYRDFKQEQIKEIIVEKTEEKENTHLKEISLEQKPEPLKEEILTKKASENSKPNPAKDLIEQLEVRKREREIRQQKTTNSEPIKKSPVEKVKDTEITKCILDGKTYTIISSAEFTENKGCYLAKGESGYTILGYIREKLIKIRYYSNLKSERIHARISEKLPSGTLRYIIRIGLQKLIVNVKEDNIEYVMDL